jgi:trimeric autotransporter adhesin
MRSNLTIRVFLFFVLAITVNVQLYSQAVNNTCATAVPLTPSATCTATTGNLQKATSAATDGSISGSCGGATAATTFDVWYKFTAVSSITTITITLPNSTNLGTSTTFVGLLSGAACASFASLKCQDISTPLVYTGLTVGTTYYIRLYTTIQGTTNPVGKWDFDICLLNPPTNDECSNSTLLYSNTSCSNTSARLGGASASTGIPAGCEAAGTYYDVWFSFVAASAVSETITLSSLTGISSQRIQIYSGSCGSLTSIACSSTSSLVASGLSVGATYYVRVSNYNAAATSTGNFDICITHPAPNIPSVDYGKSYVNISNNTGGGTIDPGDTLEIRATLVIKNNTGLDSLSFLDTLHLGGGVRFVPGSIALRTNEGTVYKSFTDAVPDDAGYYYTNATDTIVRINFGAGASATARGYLADTSKPSVFKTTMIIMATYRVVVYSGYGSTLNLGGGKITTKNHSTGVLKDLSFSARNAIVYSSPGLCPNSVSATNAIGGDYNGTFGTGSAQNRGPSSNVTGYTYSTFTTNSPGDYYYGIANNTSPGGASFTTTTTWPKADNSSPTHRVFNLWDISGDHTNATNTTKGNPPCDPTQPVSATNPCGYMLVVNSAYKTDTAFQYSVSNLCPNTYYEISAWLKNICYKCGCDSNGVAATATGYIPTGTNDSSGVKPNLTFDINGIDYYSTGNVQYGGLYPSTQSGSDSNNTWVKRGFTYLTGAAQTSFTLTIRNNAPGGGGNDWAMDDISLATCLPNMQYSPTLNPYTCSGNDYLIRDTIRSYFSNYADYKWQRSTDGGITWSDVPSATGTGSPAWNGSAYEFITSYTIPPTSTNASDSGNKYRVIVATTGGNLANSDCQVTDGVSQITLSVGSNCVPLSNYILAFNARAVNGHANLFWSTKNQQNEQLQFEIEKSIDGTNFIKIGALQGLKSANESNSYSFTDSALSAKSFYRISLINAAGRKMYSRIIQLQNSNEFLVSNVTSYFESGISLDVNVTTNSKVELALLNSSGNLVKSMSVKAYSGTNNFVLPDLSSLARGVYVLQVRNADKIVAMKTFKK